MEHQGFKIYIASPKNLISQVTNGGLFITSFYTSYYGLALAYKTSVGYFALLIILAAVWFSLGSGLRINHPFFKRKKIYPLPLQIFFSISLAVYTMVIFSKRFQYLTLPHIQQIKESAAILVASFFIMALIMSTYFLAISYLFDIKNNEKNASSGFFNIVVLSIAFFLFVPVFQWVGSFMSTKNDLLEKIGGVVLGSIPLLTLQAHFIGIGHAKSKTHN